MDYYAGQGKPLDDKRLTLSGTTSAGNQQYRIWHDAQQILVPKTQSITKPLMPENVSANVQVFGDIRKGYFRAPTVEFRNTIDWLLFDRFRLKIYRDELPDDPDIDWPDDLDIHTVYLYITIVFECQAVGYTGLYDGFAVMRNNEKGSNGESNWISDIFHFDEHNNAHVRGDFVLCSNVTPGQANFGQVFSTGQSMHPRYPIDVMVNDAYIKNGNSSMQLLTKNPTFNLEIQYFNFVLIGGE